MVAHEIPGCDKCPAGRGTFELKRLQRVLVQKSDGLYRIAKKRDLLTKGSRTEIQYPKSSDARHTREDYIHGRNIHAGE